MDKCAVGWDHHEAPQKHESQTDHKIGFGGKFGVQTDRMDKSASSFNEEPDKVGTVYTKPKPDIAGANSTALRAKFENFVSENSKFITSSKFGYRISLLLVIRGERKPEKWSNETTISPIGASKNCYV